MSFELIEELRNQLPTSDARLRKHWARRIVVEQVPVSSLLVLLHAETKVAQRLTWLIGDLLETEKSVVKECLPILFELRDQMSFPGMRRSVGKCLWYLGIPEQLEDEAIPEMFQWLDDDDGEIGVKHFAAKVLFDLAAEGRIDVRRLDRSLERQTQHDNPAHAKRMQKLRDRLSREKME